MHFSDDIGIISEVQNVEVCLVFHVTCDVKSLLNSLFATPGIVCADDFLDRSCRLRVRNEYQVAVSYFLIVTL